MYPTIEPDATTAADLQALIPPTKPTMSFWVCGLGDSETVDASAIAALPPDATKLNLRFLGDNEARPVLINTIEEVLFYTVAPEFDSD